jgi:phage gp37-like protein
VGIKTIEDAIVAEAKVALTIGGALRVRSVVSAPGDWDKDMLKRRLLAMVPCVLVVFAGGPAMASGGQVASIEAHWRVIVASGGPNEEARRVDDTQFLGAYSMLQLLIPKLDGLKIPDEGTLDLIELENLYSGEVDKQGLTLYGLTFTHPMGFPNDLDVATLDEFETFHTFYDIPPFAGAIEYASWGAGNFSTSKPDAEDTVLPPQ